jgi:outer membrane protein assembly factor BamB
MNKRKTIAIVIAVLLTVTMASSTILIPNVNAHDPAWQIPTYSFIVVSPSPIGVGQTANVNFWVNLPPPTASAQYGDRWNNLTVVVTKPDGSKQTLGPFTSDATGGTFTTFTPDVVGNYSFQMFFGGQTLEGKNPPPGPPTSNPNIGDYYKPSESNVYTLTVQEEQIGYPPVVPLPSSYWTRPIYGENNAWYTIGGNWLGLAASTFATTGMYNVNGNYAPYTTAPNTPHILWTKPEAFGGIIGGEFGGSETGNYYSTSQYEPKFAPIIMQGILYYTMYPGSSTYPAGWAAVNLHTGETIWTKNTTELLRCGQIINMITPNQYGGLAYLWSVPIESGGFMAMQSKYNMYDAMTGNYILSIVNATTMTLTNDANGNLIGYYVNSSNPFVPTLNMWNSTRCINIGTPGAYYGGGASPADNWMWRPPLGVQIDFKNGIQWTTPLPTRDTQNSSLVYMANMFGMTFPSYYLSISAVSNGKVLMTGTDAGGSFLYQPGWQEEAAFDVSDNKNGTLLWGPTNRTQVPYSIVYTGGVWAGSDAYVELTESTLSVTGYSLATGEKLWGPTSLPNASPFSSLGANAIVANGSIYIWLYGGDVYSYNIRTGALNWQYHTPSGGLESPYGVEPLWTFTVGTIADGKLFVPEGHMYSPPLFHKAQQLALNLTDGSVVWSIDAFDVTSGPAISDGVMTTLNAYDNQIYAYGKGPTKLTVSAPQASIVKGGSLVISGSISDISAGSKQEAQAANFPNGLPCVSDESMKQWMEFVYMQQPCPTNATGVPITLSVLDSNGNFRTIGTTVSDGSGFFSYQWTPDIEGKYIVVANFAGTESYYGSSAETAFAVDPVASTPAPTTSTTTAQSPIEMYVIGMGIAIIIAIAIVGALILRKRP